MNPLTIMTLAQLDKLSDEDFLKLGSEDEDEVFEVMAKMTQKNK